MNRDEAMALLFEYTKSDSLRKHAFAVDIALRAYARKFQQDEVAWGITGLLHDFDYEMYPTMSEHPYKGSEILKEKGYPDEIRTAIMGHASYTNVPRETLLAKALFACDEISGFLTACALVKPNRKIAEVELSSVKKKMKDKAFARAVSREDIIAGAQELGVPLDEHIQFVIDALKTEADVLGL
ncbi:MAG TPA: HD domain-containing protein [Bacteroidota bacterium]|nr:HD domain-containing protein [Bacteroidota bacterium]